MSNLNDPLKESYIGKVGDALAPYTDDLKAKKYDPTDLIADLTGAGKAIEAAHKARVDAEQTTAAAVQAEHDLREARYAQAADAVSLTEGLLGKTHPLPANRTRPPAKPTRYSCIQTG